MEDTCTRTMHELQLSFCPVNDQVVSSKPIMTEDHFICFGFSKQEVESFLVVANHEEQVDPILDQSFMVLRIIHVGHTDQFL